MLLWVWRRPRVPRSERDIGLSLVEMGPLLFTSSACDTTEHQPTRCSL